MVTLSPNIVDFIERVGATAFEAGAAVYLAAPHAGTAKTAGIAAGIAALKFLYLKVAAWQAAHTGSSSPARLSDADAYFAAQASKLPSVPPAEGIELSPTPSRADLPV